MCPWALEIRTNCICKYQADCSMAQVLDYSVLDPMRTLSFLSFQVSMPMIQSPKGLSGVLNSLNTPLLPRNLGVCHDRSQQRSKARLFSIYTILHECISLSTIRLMTRYRQKRAMIGHLEHKSTLVSDWSI